MRVEDALSLLDRLIQAWYEADERRELERSCELAEHIEVVADMIPLGLLRSGPPSVRDYFGFETLPLTPAGKAGVPLH